MTDTQTPERIWISDIGWDLQSVEDLEALGFAWSKKHGNNPREFIPADLHAAVIAERDQLKAYALEATIALTEKLNVGGSEFFAGRIGEFYKADIPFCIESAQRRIEAFNRLTVAKLEAQIRDLEDQLTELEKHRA